jgi:WD40 repeat protein
MNRTTMRQVWMAFAALAMILIADTVPADELPSEPLLRIDAAMHTAPINRIGLSADGMLLASGSADKTVRLWSVPDGRLLRTLRLPLDAGNGGKVYAVALSPDGTIVAAGGWDAAVEVSKQVYVTLFDSRTGTILHRLGPLPNVVNELQFSPDGKKLVAGIFGNKNGIQVWNTADWTTARVDRSYGDDVYGASFAADGRLVTTSYDGMIRLYDAALVLKAKVRASGGKRPHGVVFSPDGQLVAVGFTDAAKVDVLSAGNLKLRFSADTAGVDNGFLARVAWSGDGNTLFAGGAYGVSGRTQILAWPDGGRGPRGALAAAVSNTVLDLKPFGRGGVAFAAFDPAFGVIDDAGRSVLFKGPVTANMRNKLGNGFTISTDARQVRFGLDVGDSRPSLFDVSGPSFAASPDMPVGLHVSTLDGLNVTDWEDTPWPKLAGQALHIDQYELARSLAVMPDRSGFLLGASWSLRRFDGAGKQIWNRPVPGEAWGVNLSEDGGIAVVAYTDGTIRWLRTSDGTELLALFVQAQDQRWVAWTPSGYYAASVGGESLIGWHVNHGLDQAPDFFPAQRFHDRFYRPDIVQAVLTTLDEAAAVEAANTAAHRKEVTTPLAAQLPPVITITGPASGSRITTNEVTLDYDLGSPSGLPIDTVDILIDGRPVVTRGLARIDATKTVTLGAGHITVTVPPRSISVALVAHAGQLASEASQIDLVWSGGAPLQGADLLKPKLYALVVGVSAYDDPNLALGYAAKDARDFSDALKAQSGRLYGAVETRVLADHDASRDAILDGLDWLSTQVTSRDVGVIFLAGHGVSDTDGYWYLPADVKLDRIHRTAVSEDDVRRTLSKLPSKVILFLDTCHAGKLLADAGATSRGLARADADITAIVNDLASAENGVVAFASSTGREVSLERSEWGNGAFTKALVEGLDGKADLLHNGSITLSELDAYVVNRVKQLTDGQQHAVMSRPSTVSDYPIAVTSQ